VDADEGRRRRPWGRHQGEDRQAESTTGRAGEANWAEDDAFAALDYAAWSVHMARLAVLDAIDARAYADERAKLASPQ
jgi:hypothetical protein